jgi:hypothetical protein
MNSSDEDDIRSTKYSKLDVDLSEIKARKKNSEQVIQSVEKIMEKPSIEDKSSKLLLRSTRSTSDNLKNLQTEEIEKEKNDTIVASNIDDIEELSMYEDAIGKPTPLMNSTLKYSSVMSEKILNPVVILEQLSQHRKLNETVTIEKASNTENNKESKEINKKALQDSTQIYKEIMQNDDNCNGLITDDESPAEKKSKNQPGKKETKYKKLSFSDDEIPNTPMKERFRDAIASAITQENKNTYKSNALFSPYAKESVKKRVEAFEQAVMHSPKPVDVDVPMRMTRTKTRAMTAAETEAETRNTDKNVTQILARKSLAKAKKISLAKQKKDNEELKEVKAYN